MEPGDLYMLGKCYVSSHKLICTLKTHSSMLRHVHRIMFSDWGSQKEKILFACCVLLYTQPFGCVCVCAHTHHTCGVFRGQHSGVSSHFPS